MPDPSRPTRSTRAVAAKGSVPKERLLGVFERGPALDISPEFKKTFADGDTFAKSPLGKRLLPFRAQSSLEVARTRNPLVLVRVVDSVAIPRSNVRLELFDSADVFLDAVVSDSIGLGLLRWPSQPPADGTLELKGRIRLDGGQRQDVVVPAGKDFVVVHITFSGAPPAVTTDDDEQRHDSVVPRLPAFFSIKAADEILRHRVTADGPDPCFHAAMERQCTYRAPRVRWIYARRIAYGGLTPPRRLYVRVRQEWHYIGHSFGQPERIDSRDVASLVGTLDANIEAGLAVTARLDASTDSVLSADASARLRAAASLDGELDASVGLHLFEGGLGNPLSVSGDADVSIDTSLLVSAQLKLRASLRNQLHAKASLNGRASVGLEADASVSVNPSLSRELNIPRFVIHENYVVTSFVEDVQEIQEVPLFDDLSEKLLSRLPDFPYLPFPAVRRPLFLPADVVEYRPIFERRLLEPALAGRFRALRVALESAAGRGPLVRRLRFDITYAGTGTGRFHVEVLGLSAVVTLRPGQSQARVAIDLPGGQFFDTLNGETMDFHLTIDVASLFTGGLGSVRVTSINVFSDASPLPQAVPLSSTSPLEVTGAHLADSLSGTRLQLRSADAGLGDDPLVVHINRNPTYYMGLLVKAAIANPSLRFDVPQLRRIGPDSPLWKVPIHGFAGNKALVLVPATGKEVDTLLGDLGRSTVIQLAVDGNWSEAIQGQNAIADALGQLFGVLDKLELPLSLLEGLTSGAGLIPRHRQWCGPGRRARWSGRSRERRGRWGAGRDRRGARRLVPRSIHQSTS